MANELIRMKSGLIKNIEKDETGHSPVNIQAGTIYFAVDDDKETGKILYDVDSTHRVVMSTQAEYADEAGKTIGITGIYAVKGMQTKATSVWTGAIEGVNELFDGLTIAYYLPYNGTSTAATLDLTLANGDSTGPINVYYTATTRVTTHYSAGSTIILTYWSAGSIKVSGTATAEARWTRADYDNTITYQLRHIYGSYTAAAALYRYQVLLTKDETSLLPVNSVNNNTGTSKTLTTESFDPFGPIYYYNATTNIAADGAITAGNLFEQVLADLRYSFNTGTTLTARKAIYIVAIPQSNGLAKLDSTPITQTLPTAKDGKIYIYLGQVYYENSGNCYRVELEVNHPVYYYKNGKIALYTGEPIATSSNTGLMSADDKIKLDGIAEEATNTTIFATSPIIASASTGAVTLSHAASGVAANTYGTTATTAINPSFGDTFSVPGFKVNTTGHITSAGAHTVKIPSTLATSEVDGLMSHTDKGNFDLGVTIAGNQIDIGDELSATDLRTSLGLSNAMHFIGHATVSIGDNTTTDPEILDYDFGVNGANATPGDVIIDSTTNYEYVWSSLGRWERLGGDSSYKVVQSAVSDFTYNESTTTTTFVSAVTQNTNGVITVTKRKLPTYNNYTHPTYTAKTAAAVKVGNDSTGHVVIGDALTKSDVGLSNVTNDAQIPKSIGTAKGDIIYFSASGTPTRLAVGGNGTVLKVNSSGVPAWASDSDSHYTTHLYAGASDGNTNAATTNGNTYLIVTDNTTARDRRKIAGTGATTVTSDANGNITIDSTNTTYTFDGTYDSSTNKAATVSTVTNAINALDGNLNSTTPGAGKTLTAFSQTNGKVSATFGNISITKSQISDFPTTMTPASHTHGKITNDGKIASTDNVTIANNDRLIISDASDSYILKNTSIVFDGSTTNKALTPKGTWEPFNNYSLPLAANGTRGGIQIGYSSSGKNYAVQLSSEKAFVNVPWTDTKQNITLQTTKKGYITAVETTPTGTAAAHEGIADTGVYLTTTAGQINAKTYKVDEEVTLEYNTTTKSLDFIFA